MATRRYKISPGKKLGQVVEEVGAATTSDVVELTVDLGALVHGASGTRTVTKEEVLIALENLEYHITKSIWPPA